MKLERIILTFSFLSALSTCNTESSQHHLNPAPEECRACDEILPEYCLRLICPEEYELQDCTIFRGDGGSYYRPCGHEIIPCYPNGDADYTRCDGGVNELN